MGSTPTASTILIPLRTFRLRHHYEWYSHPTIEVSLACQRFGDREVDIRYYIDPETGEPHIYRHNVSEDEVEDVLRRPGEDRPGNNGARIATGHTEVGRHLRVVYVPDPIPRSVFVITAYDLVGKPLAAYRRRWRKK